MGAAVASVLDKVFSAAGVDTSVIKEVTDNLGITQSNIANAQPKDQQAYIDEYRRLLEAGVPQSVIDTLVVQNLHPDIPASTDAVGVVVAANNGDTSSPAVKAVYDSLSWWEKIKFNVKYLTKWGYAIIGIAIGLFVFICWLLSFFFGSRKGNKSYKSKY